MADKEATVYIVDIGRSMGKKHHDRDKTDLDWALQYFWDKVTSAVMTGRKTLNLGVIGLRTDGTNVSDAGVNDPEGYENISVLQTLKQTLLSDVRDLQAKLVPSASDEGDAISAVVAAITMIANATKGKSGKPLQYKRKIVLITSGLGTMNPEDSDQLDAIVSKIKEDGIQLVLIGVDFDDADFGFKEEEKTHEKTEIEAYLKKLTDDCGGVFATLAEAVEGIDTPETKKTRPVKSYQGTLTLGNPEKYDSAMTINVERYPRTSIARPVTAKTWFIKRDPAAEDGTQSTHTVAEDAGDGLNEEVLGGVKTQRVFQIQKEGETGSKIDVPQEELESGYAYGRTAVHIAETDKVILELDTLPSLDIIGFIPEDKFERYLAMTKTNIIVAQKGNDMASLALSSFIHALYETASYAVARFAAKEKKNPLILLLAPLIQPDFEGLIDFELPFAEDVRDYKFPPLDRKVTVAGKSLTQHRDLPTPELMDAMSAYVDAMDLSTFGADDDGNPADYMPMDETYSPLVHRVHQIVRWRATHPTAQDLPGPPAILTKFSTPPEELAESSKPLLEALMRASDVKKVPPKQQGRKRTREREKPLSGLNIDELLSGQPKRARVDPSNPIPTFKQTLATTDNIDTFKIAVADLAKVVYSYITNSVGDSRYGQAIECIRVMREEMTELEEPALFNGFMQELKTKIFREELNGNRRDMWMKVRMNRVGLIDQKLSPFSEVTEEVAREFWKPPT
ncbi:putative Ku family DNA helicase [Lophium mytilinum]|uniref:ATP-dependent DNA helicase II subunit 2 n=1 Tax=Lophium mytilinum TaxID=390894 RepID=A0A6A6RHC7_9PEZI|nr:putative Ku family DNA helicase [Lophium mytilinum]